MKTIAGFKKDELVAVDWIDTASNGTAAIETAGTEPRRTVGIYKGVKRQSFASDFEPKKLRFRKVLVMTDTRDNSLPGQEGWTAIPLHNVLAITGLMLTKKRWAQ